MSEEKKTWGAVRKRVCPWCKLALGKGKIVLLDGAAYHAVCGDVKSSFDAAVSARESEDLERKKAGLL